MIDDLADELRAFEGSDALGNGDFSVCVRGAGEITRFRAELAAARREGMEEAAREIDCAMRELFGDADEYKQGWNDGLEAGAAAIRAAAGEGKP